MADQPDVPDNSAPSSTMALHRQVEVAHPRFGTVAVDEGLATLLPALWAIDIYTSLSCELNEGRPDRSHTGGSVWLNFSSPNDSTLFLVALFRDDPDMSDDGLRNRAAWKGAGKSPDFERAWHWDIWPQDIERTTRKREPKGAFKLSVNLRIPPSDLPEVTRRIVARRTRPRTPAAI